MSLIYINNDKFFKKIDKDIKVLSELKIDKNDIITSTIYIKDVITYTFKLPLSTPKEQIDTEVNIQLYDNAGLDINKQYKTFFLIKELKDTEVYLIEAIAVEENILQSKFQNIVKKTHFIDYISLSVLYFSEFYKLYKKEATRDAFVYLDNEQSFITIYKDGEYLYSKTLNPLNPLLKTINLDYNQFTELMKQKGVNKANYEVDDFLIVSEIDKFFSDYFMAINNRVSYGKNIFDLDNIDNIYFYTPFEINGIDTLKEFWDVTGINFEVIKVEDINLLDKLAIYYNEKHYQDEINFSIFPRPPKFYKTKTFQFFMGFVISILLFVGDFGYRYYQKIELQNNIVTLQKQIKIKSTKLSKLEQKNKLLLQRYQKIQKKISDLENKINYIKNVVQKSLEIINLFKVNEDLVNITSLLEKNKLKIFAISKDINNSFDIKVYTNLNNRESIAVFMNDLLDEGYTDIQTNKIYTINKNYYMSLIRFKK